MANKKIPITLNGIEYDSVNQCCRENGISSTCVWRIALKKQITHVDAITKYAKLKKIHLKKNIELDFLYKKWVR